MQLAGGQPQRVLSQQMREREKMVQFDVLAEALFPLIDGRRRDAQCPGDLRLGQARLFPGGSNSISQRVHDIMYPPIFSIRHFRISMLEDGLVLGGPVVARCRLFDCGGGLGGLHAGRAAPEDGPRHKRENREGQQVRVDSRIGILIE